MKLSNNEEIIGKLAKVRLLENGQIKLSLSIQKDIEFSANAFAYKKLKSLIGQKIGICNFDGKYFLRQIKSR